MSKNELNVSLYDSLLVDGHTNVVNDLKFHEQNIEQIVLLSARALGQELFLARQTMYDSGIENSFDKWVSVLGLSKRTAYNYIDVYEASLKLSDNQNELIESLPDALSYAVSNKVKRDADKRDDQTNEALDKVFNGDITTLPEFKAALASKDLELASKESQLNYAIENAEDWKFQVVSLRNDYAEVNSALKETRAELADKEANPIVREVERYPDDYKQLKVEHDEAISKLEKLSSKLSSETNLRKELAKQRDSARERSHSLELRLSTISDSDDDYEYLQNQLADANVKLQEQEKDLAKKDLELEKFESATNYISQANQSLDATLSPLLVQINPEDLETDSPIYSALVDLQQRTNNWSQTMSARLSEVK